MPLPTLIFGALLSTMLGAGFHLWRGGGGGQLVLDLLLGWLGFWAGQWIAEQMGWTFASLGALHLVPAFLGSLALMLLGAWLGPSAPEKQSPRRR